jgi:hypothetical protein
VGAIGVPEEYDDGPRIVAWKQYTLDESDTLTTTANQQGQDIARGCAEMVADAWSTQRNTEFSGKSPAGERNL